MPRQTEQSSNEDSTVASNVEDTLDQLFRFSRAVRRSGMLHRHVKIANHTEYGPDGVNLTSEFHTAISRIIDHYLKGCTASQELRSAWWTRYAKPKEFFLPQIAEKESVRDNTSP
ncbi:hypothetical protein N7481_002471 [Penicillium waksmanii]|uniref:uncharacterized protein n=1 Tax=Penicillium waksmanii TaxID=69791 RepID=UPI0025470E0C|nr:uncharacterized protein N7481_002471 [Penicillium waksmanii]KAJ5995494.1 hypothetical protein N7481_002471 [Penicillium waksmanii]